jgi:hypothetical protein
MADMASLMESHEKQKAGNIEGALAARGDGQVTGSV